MKKKLIIAVVGLNLAGKDTVAGYLVTKGFTHLSLSDILREICRRRKSYRGRDDLIRIGNLLRKQYGLGYLARKALQKAEQSHFNKLVVSSVRNPGEVRELKRHSDFFMIEVIAPRLLRYERAKKRGKIDDHVTLAEFTAQENRERKGAVHQQQLDKVIGTADFSLTNEMTREDLFNKVDRLLNLVMRKRGEAGQLNIVILGPQGSGKGTQAEVLAERFHLARLETGKIFRELARRKNPLGRKMHFLINVKGRLVPSPFVIKVLKDKLANVKHARGLIFDGFPRNLVQAKALDRLLRSLGRQLTHVIYLPISRQTTIKRLARRRTCRQCGRVFILGKNLRRGASRCPVCGGQIYQREDDKPRAIAKRLEIYLKLTKPLIAYYKERGILVTVDGEPPIPKVTQQILRLLS